MRDAEKFVRDRFEVDAASGTCRHYQDYYDQRGCFVRSERVADVPVESNAESRPPRQ